MNDCKGIFGKLFGHKFVRFLLKSRSSFPFWTEITINNREIKETLKNDADRDIYIVRCKRCGAAVDENQK